MHPNEPDWKKDLSPPPLTGRGFDDKLRRRIEEQLDRKEARRRKRLWLWPAAVSTGLLTAGTALFAFGLLPQGPGSVAETGTAAAASAAVASTAAPTDGGALADAAAGIRSGVLIGLRKDAGGTGTASAADAAEVLGSYRTLMIAPVDGRVQVAAEGSGILVPYGQKFWKLDPVLKRTENGYVQWISARQADRPLNDEAVPALTEEGLIHTEQLVFAGNQYVSVAKRDVHSKNSRTAASESRYAVLRLNQMPGAEPAAGSAGTAAAKATGSAAAGQAAAARDDGRTAAPLAPAGITLSDIYGQGALDILKQLAAGVSSPASAKPEPAAKGTYAASPLSGDNWTVTRKPGRWAAQAAVPGSGATVALADFPTALPETVTAHDEVNATWGQIRALRADTQDVVASPLEDLMVLFTTEEMVVYRNAAAGSEPLLRIALKPGEKLVSAQWATGSYVPSWIEKTRKYLEAPQEPAE